MASIHRFLSHFPAAKRRILALALVAMDHGAWAGDQGLRAGAAAVDITPDWAPVVVNGNFLEQTASVAHDRLMARTVVFDDGTTKLAVTIVDSCLMPRELLDAAKNQASRRTGLPADRMLIAATHTHSAPSTTGALGSDADPRYPAFLIDRLAKGIEEALSRLEPAEVGWGVIDVEGMTHNRRWILRPDRVREDPFGGKTIRANMHPGYQHPDFVGPSGPVDSTLTALMARSTSGRPIALLTNFSMHYYGAAPMSSDYYGRYCRMIEEKVAAGSKRSSDSPAPFVAIMSQGTSGDLMWMDYGKPERKPNIDAYAASLAEKTLSLIPRLTFRRDPTLAMVERKLAIDRRVPSVERLAWAKGVVAAMAGRKPKTLPEVYAREAIILSQEPRRELKLQAITIGGLGIAAIPNEVYAITGLGLKRSLPVETAIVIELANGAEGYIPPPEQHALGGYETWPARSAGLEEQAEPLIASTLESMFQSIVGRPVRAYSPPETDYSRAVAVSKPRVYWRLDDFRYPVDSLITPRPVFTKGVVFGLPGPPLGGATDPVTRNRAIHFAGGRLLAEGVKLGDRHTIEFFVRNVMPPDARPAGRRLLTVAANGDKGSERHWTIDGAAGQPGRLVLRADKERSLTAGKLDLGLNQWRHVAIIRDGNRLRAHVDGSLAPDLEANDTPPTGAATISFGGEGDAGFLGSIDEIAVYDRPLEPAEVASHAKAWPGD